MGQCAVFCLHCVTCLHHALKACTWVDVCACVCMHVCMSVYHRCGNDPDHSLSQPRRQQQQQRKPPAVRDRPGLTCLVWQRTFTSISGRTRHKCKLTDIQITAAPPLECSACHRTFRSTSGRTRHRCSRVTSTI